MSDRVVLVAGTRPELIKLHPVAVALAAKRIPATLITTGQHRSPEMRDAFVEGLGWPIAAAPLPISDDRPLPLLAEIVRLLPGTLGAGDVVVVEGDTTSVLAAGLVANKLRLPLAHVEAGLRSFDARMPEEHNRRVVDHLADLLFAPTSRDVERLRREDVRGEIHLVGNTVLDAVRLNMTRAPAATRYGVGHVLVTLHRQENVDDPAFLRAVLRALRDIGSRCLLPLHPRTRDRFVEEGLWSALVALTNVDICGPLDHYAFLAVMRDARIIVTDSGGVQEEATAPEIRRPVVVVRRSTERVPAVDAGFAVLASPEEIAVRVGDPSWYHPAERSPFGDGHAAEAIVAVLEERLAR